MNEMEMSPMQNIANEHNETGVFVISSPSDQKTEEITDELIAKLIRVARVHFMTLYSILPLAMNSITFSSQRATKLHYVMTPEV